MAREEPARAWLGAQGPHALFIKWLAGIRRRGEGRRSGGGCGGAAGMAESFTHEATASCWWRWSARACHVDARLNGLGALRRRAAARGIAATLALVVLLM